MSEPTTERCPRCGSGFHCGAADAVPCACTAVRLDAATLAALRQQYQGCLCLACLSSLSQRRDDDSATVAPGPGQRPQAASGRGA